MTTSFDVRDCIAKWDVAEFARQMAKPDADPNAIVRFDDAPKLPKRILYKLIQESSFDTWRTRRNEARQMAVLLMDHPSFGANPNDFFLLSRDLQVSFGLFVTLFPASFRTDMSDKVDFDRCRSGLIIKPKWLKLIKDGDKVWEVRVKPWKHRGLLALIEASTKHVQAVCGLVACHEVKAQDFASHHHKHRVGQDDMKSLPKSYRNAQVLYCYEFEGVVDISQYEIYSTHKAGPTRPLLSPKIELAVLRALYD